MSYLFLDISSIALSILVGDAGAVISIKSESNPTLPTPIVGILVIFLVQYARFSSEFSNSFSQNLLILE